MLAFRRAAYITRLLCIVVGLAVLCLVRPVFAAPVDKPAYVASEGICTDSEVVAKATYVMGLLKQYNDNNAKGLTEKQVEKIWDKHGLCNGAPVGATLTRTSKTAFMTADYFGAYVSAKVKYAYGKLDEARYFADEFNAVAGMIRSRAKQMSWNDWLQLDATYTKDVALLSNVLTKRGYPADPAVAAVGNLFNP